MSEIRGRPIRVSWWYGTCCLQVIAVAVGGNAEYQLIDHTGQDVHDRIFAILQTSNASILRGQANDVDYRTDLGRCVEQHLFRF